MKVVKPLEEVKTANKKNVVLTEEHALDLTVLCTIKNVLGLVQELLQHFIKVVKCQKLVKMQDKKSVVVM